MCDALKSIFYLPLRICTPLKREEKKVCDDDWGEEWKVAATAHAKGQLNSII